MRILIVLLFAFVLNLGQAQRPSADNLADLNFYSDVMINAESYSNRLRAHDKFSKLFKETLNSKGSWELNLEAIPFIHSLVSPDSLFKIYTFNLSDQKNITTEAGYIQLKSGQIFELKATNYLDDLEYNQYSSDDWLSGIYYHIIPFTSDKKTKYILFSYSQPTEFQKRKVIEVLHFEEDKPIFGSEVFVEKNGTARDIIKSRRVYNYSADVAMVIQHDMDYNAIIIDHLMEVKSRIPGNSENTAVPDGTYTSYTLQDGNWMYRNMVFDPTNDTPAEEAKEEKVKSGIFGQETKSKN